MATRTVVIPGTAFMSGGVAFPEPATIKATNDFWKTGVMIFPDTATKDAVGVEFDVPQDYVGTPKFQPIWTAAGTPGGNVQWEFAYRTVGGDDTTSLDQATAEETLTITDAAPTATDRRLAPTAVAATAANFSVGETIQLNVARDGTSGSDTMAAAAQLRYVIFSYTDV